MYLFDFSQNNLKRIIQEVPAIGNISIRVFLIPSIQRNYFTSYKIRDIMCLSMLCPTSHTWGKGEEMTGRLPQKSPRGVGRCK